MGYKSVLTVVTLPETRLSGLRAAAGLTRAFEGHLDVLCLGVDPVQTGYSLLGPAAVILEPPSVRADVAARAAEAGAQKFLATEPPELRFSVESAVVQMAALCEFVAAHARYADLVVLPRPQDDDGIEAMAVVEATLFEARAAVLIVPQTRPALAKPVPARPATVVVAWNQSREAMAAVRHALPLLQQAGTVDIAVIDPPAHGVERSDPGGALCQMLVRHGVRAGVTVLARTLPRVSDVLMRHVRDRDADLVVMGAYGHSRLREAILGGATQDMLAAADVPLLMAH